MRQMEVTLTELDPAHLLELKAEIVERWERLPPAHQATMLLVLLDGSAWAHLEHRGLGHHKPRR